MRTILVLVTLLLGAPLSAVGQSFGGKAGVTPLLDKPDLAVSYQFMRSNTQPGDCGCFALNGVGLSASWTFRPDLAAVVEGDTDFARNGPGTSNSLTLITSVVGVRYRLPVQPPARRGPQFFVEPMGGGHAGGGIAGAGDGTFAFVGRAGGGYDQAVTERFAFRLEADYVPTTFANEVNNRQNNLLIAFGFVFHSPSPR